MWKPLMYSLKGREPVPVASARDWDLGTILDRRVAWTSVGRVEVSTVFLGVDYQFGDGPPLLFETMVFPVDGDGLEDECRRYSTWDDAERGHWEIVAKHSVARA